MTHLIATWGAPIVFAACFLQAAGIPVPGTTVLISAALYAGTTHHLSIVAIVPAAAVGAILGHAVAFGVGRRAGPALLERWGPRVRLTPRRQFLARRLVAGHGGKLVFFGRFVTGLRTWSGVLAGASGMDPARFGLFSVAGGVAWATLNGVGYYLYGHALATASTGVDIALGVLGAAWLVLSARYLRRTLGTLELAAESRDPVVPVRR